MINQHFIYLIGLGGIGMSGLARLFLAAGKKVAGSDLKHSDILENVRMLGAEIFVGHDPAHLSSGVELVVYSADITEESAGFVELLQARKLGIPVMTYAKALGQMMEGHFGMAVTGTNGKSTTGALLGLFLEAGGLDPTVLIGTQLAAANESERFQANARLGAGQYVVVEADEYQRKMLELKPQIVVLTNVAEDHLDYYRDLADVKLAFTDFIRSLPEDGALIFNADDHNSVDVAHHAKCHKLTFGIHHYADLQALNLKIDDNKQIFDMHFKDKFIGTFALQIPGKFNIANVLGAALAALRLGVEIGAIKQVLDKFVGTWRRFEPVGRLHGISVISDYGHHPDGIRATMEGVREMYPGEKILLVFQPHHRNRTKKLFGEFLEALTSVEHLIIPEIFDVAGREHGEDVSSKDLVTELRKLGTNAEYAADLVETERMVRARVKEFDLIIMMGAGDIDLLARKLVTRLSA